MNSSSVLVSSVYSPAHDPALTPRVCVCVGLTPLHVAVLSHNAAVQEQCVSQSLQQKRKMLSECIGTLMLMGASLETKVNTLQSR